MIRKQFSPGQLWLIGGGVLLLLIGMALSLAPRFLAPLVRSRMIHALKEGYESDVELRDIDISLFPVVRMTGDGVVLRHKGRIDVPPLVEIRRFSVDANWLGLLRFPARVSRVNLEGLQVHVPPRRSDDMQNPPKAGKKDKKDMPQFVVGEVIADGTSLTILPKKEGKDPLQFDIKKLTLWGAGPSDPMSFRATLINAKPVGEIQSEGKFGPWHKDEPSLTPVAGRYTFQHADLSVFKGISGILSSEGAYTGILESIQVQGTTDTPDFMLDVSGKPTHLTTQFQAEVDGTDGDTRLQPVVGQFGSSAVTARGSVEGKEGTKGKTITLDITVTEGRLEDMLRLGVKSDTPLMTGAIGFHALLVIPPGDRDMVEKIQLNGTFAVAEAHFATTDVQDKVNKLSHRSRGETDDNQAGLVASNFRGKFVLKNAVLTLDNLSFSVPGLGVRLNGQYGLRDERFDLKGTASLQAKLSETTTGFKSFLLKAVDPFFKKKDVGAVIPIKIEGTIESPSFGLNL